MTSNEKGTQTPTTATSKAQHKRDEWKLFIRIRHQFTPPPPKKKKKKNVKL